MKRSVPRLQAIVSRECSLIPKDTYEQRMLRGAFAIHRQAGLAGNPEAPATRRAAIRRSIEDVRKLRPDFQPRYDSLLDAEVDGTPGANRCA